jgi:hypothetical protein
MLTRRRCNIMAALDANFGGLWPLFRLPAFGLWLAPAPRFERNTDESGSELDEHSDDPHSKYAASV